MSQHIHHRLNCPGTHGVCPKDGNHRHTLTHVLGGATHESTREETPRRPLADESKRSGPPRCSGGPHGHRKEGKSDPCKLEDVMRAETCRTHKPRRGTISLLQRSGLGKWMGQNEGRGGVRREGSPGVTHIQSPSGKMGRLWRQWRQWCHCSIGDGPTELEA